MSDTPFELAGNLRVGAVDFVSPSEIRVTLDSEAPESVALNAGHPRPFPRVNSYLMVQVDEAFLIGQVQSLTIERAPFPRHSKIRDAGFIDLPYPLRQLKLNPLGMLRNKSERKYAFQRGSESLPSVGAAVLLPTRDQLYAIVQLNEYRRVKVGTSPLAGDADVCVDPNRLFGRHLAVLGNTGSGKSCSVAGLIRWSLEAAAETKTKANPNGKHPNARFIVLDPNGEYSRAFKDDSKIKSRTFKVDPEECETELRIPSWFWNSEEWCAFVQASERAQRPRLLQALRYVKSGQLDTNNMINEAKKQKQRRYLMTRLALLQEDISSGKIESEGNKFGKQLKAMKETVEQLQREFPNDNLDKVTECIQNLLNENDKSWLKNGEIIETYGPTSLDQIAPVIESLRVAVRELGGSDIDVGVNEDIPLPFNNADLIGQLEILAEEGGVIQYVEPLITRIQTLLSKPVTKSIISNRMDESDINLEEWLGDYVGSNKAENGCVSIIDLSLVPTEVVHIVTAVVARIVFESLQRYMKLNKKTLPTVLVMEEAHTFVKRYKQSAEDYDAGSTCCQVFERIAREGRKFGLGLVISSQRPSEISPTVLSQCNTFLLHRISNDHDQELVQKLVPDNLRGLLRELPLLPSQRAILLGWASELPVLVKMRDLPENQRPQSDDPDIWEVWTHEKEREVDWVKIASEWQDRAPKNQTSQDNNPNTQQEGEGQKGDTGDGNTTSK